MRFRPAQTFLSISQPTGSKPWTGIHTIIITAGHATSFHHCDKRQRDNALKLLWLKYKNVFAPRRQNGVSTSFLAVMRQAKICPDSSLACPALLIVCQNNLYNLYINEKLKKFLGKKHRITKTNKLFLNTKFKKS